jgi:hypothetical protein
MRSLGSALVGVLVLFAATPARADPQGMTFRAGAVPGMAQPSAGSAPHPAPGQVRHWNSARVSPHWGPDRSDSFRGPHRGWASLYTGWGAPYVPYAWGGRYVPYPSYGDWGALWYPYAEWRGPTGGWGNP